MMLAVLALGLAACGTTPGSAVPTTAATGGAEAGSASSTPAAPAATATATAETAPPRELVLGCLSITDAECRFLAQQVLATLPAERGAPFSIQIQLYQCENPDVPCPQTLDVRQGKAVVEFTDGEMPIDLSLGWPSLAPTIAPIDTFYLGLSHPSSPRVVGGGPFPYDMGHCGLTHVIDFDGSYWVPVGQVDGDHPTVINAESGSMLLINPNLAEFHGDSGFMVQLARFPGPKHFWGCD
jgi:hypothetical protein